jgi:Family of unknown function (DUF6370)
MKNILSVLFFMTCCVYANAQKKLATQNKTNLIDQMQVVEVSCGQCQFKMIGQEGCDLAVRINGKSYFVDGTTIDDHGDAHADDGFCKAVRKASVKGKIINGRFKATYFKLL